MKTVSYEPSDDPRTEEMRVNWGGNDDPALFLTPGEAYDVVGEEVHSSHTKLSLNGFPGLVFNSTHFIRIIQRD